jgi:hypothetical protein
VVSLLYCFMSSDVRMALKKRYYRQKVRIQSRRMQNRNRSTMKVILFLFINYSQHCHCIPQQFHQRALPKIEFTKLLFQTHYRSNAGNAARSNVQNRNTENEATQTMQLNSTLASSETPLTGCTQFRMKTLRFVFQMSLITY